MRRGLRRSSPPHAGGADAQAFTEFALVLPVMLVLLLGAADLARFYQAWISLESATRDAAEYVATNSTSTSAAADAQRVVCAEFGQSATCTDPSVTVSGFSLSATAPGATSVHPIASVTVSAHTAFHTVIPYPFITSAGAVSLASTRAEAIVQGRKN